LLLRFRLAQQLIRAIVAALPGRRPRALNELSEFSRLRGVHIEHFQLLEHLILGDHNLGRRRHGDFSDCRQH
jgi:hypothetical protein